MLNPYQRYATIEMTAKVNPAFRSHIFTNEECQPIAEIDLIDSLVDSQIGEIKHYLNAKDLIEFSSKIDMLQRTNNIIDPIPFVVCRRYTQKAIALAKIAGIKVYHLDLSQTAEDALLLHYSHFRDAGFYKRFDLKRHYYKILDLSGEWLPMRREISDQRDLWREVRRYIDDGYTPSAVYISLCRQGHPKGAFDGKGYGQDSNILPIYDIDILEKNHDCPGYRCNATRNIYPPKGNTHYISSGHKGIYRIDEERVSAMDYYDRAIELGAETFTSNGGIFDTSRVVKAPHSVSLHDQRIVSYRSRASFSSNLEVIIQ